jgi:phosphatidylglycerol:prolipoprotein diacylglycerol transferase
VYEILFQNAFITVRTFNIVLAVGFLFAGIVMIRYISRKRMDASFVAKYFVYFALAVIIGGRIGYVLENLDLFRQTPLYSLYVWDLNFSFFGALAGLLISLFIIARLKKEEFWAWVDVSVLTLLALMTFVHLGHFFDGTHYGMPTKLPIGISFDTSTIPFTTPIHPVQLYSMLLTIIVLSYSIKKSRRTHLPGVVGSIALMLYSLAMLGMNFLHGNPSLYDKIGYSILAVLAFIAYIHCSHKSHITKNRNE